MLQFYAYICEIRQGIDRNSHRIDEPHILVGDSLHTICCQMLAYGVVNEWRTIRDSTGPILDVRVASA